MRAIKVKATVNEQGSLSLDHPLEIQQNSRVEVIVLVNDTEDNDPDDEFMDSKQEILEDFRQAWDEAMTKKTIPVSQLWEGIENV